MKQTIILLLSIVLLIMAFPFHSSGNNREIDFNFPRDVSNEALTDLDKALKSGDGELTIDALVRYGIAKTRGCARYDRRGHRPGRSGADLR